MGVPDEIDGPVRKRPRLSLRASHRPDQSKSSSETSSIKMTTENTTGTNQSSYALVKTLDLPSESIDLTADLPSSPDPLVAPVASLHNLGNTCFLNSMLEVLRYTPGFLDGLHRLQEQILIEEDKWDTKNSETGISEVRSAWQIVKNTCANRLEDRIDRQKMSSIERYINDQHLSHMFTEMDKREAQYKEVATADASSMAVRPSALLDNIRELNPMFEGHFQHDAQELLRCLLCYIEDAEKELTQLKDREGAEGEDTDRIREAKPSVLDTEEREQIDVGVTEKRTTAHTGSLKGGESHDRSKVTDIGRQRRPDMARNIHVKNIVNCETKAAASAMNVCDEVKSTNGNSGVVEADDHITSIKLEGEEDEASVSGLSSLQASKGSERKRSKSKSASGNRLIGASNDVATRSTARTRGLRRKAAGSDTHTCPKSVCIHEETASAVPGSAGHKRIENIVADCYSHVDCHQNLQTKAAVSPDCAMSPSTSATASAATKFETESSSSRIVSFQPLNQIKRLGMRGRAMINSVCQAGEQLMHADNNSNNNIGDVNNNNDTCNSNDSGCAGVATDGRCAGVATDSNIHVHVLELPGCNHQTSSPLCIGNTSPGKALLQSPAKSPAMVEPADEITVIPEGGTSQGNSPINTVTRKYISSVSRSSTAASSQVLPSLTPQSALTCTEPGLAAGSPRDVSPLHVLEPNKEINVTVQVSPKKKSSGLEFSGKPGCCVPWDKPSNEKLALSPEDTSKCLVSLGDTYPSGVQDNKDRDSVLWTWLNITDVSAHEGKSQFPETLQTSDDLAAPCTQVRSPCDQLPRQVAFAKTYSAQHNLLKPMEGSPQRCSLSSRDQDTAAQRSPGANIPHNISTLQPKLELRRCDWLGVSPVKSVSVTQAMSILGEQRMGLGSLTAKRKILYDDSESAPHSSSTFSSVVNCLPTVQSHDMSCLGTDTGVIDGVSSNIGPVLAESDSKQRRTKVTLLRPARKSARTSQATQLTKQTPCTSNKMLTTGAPLLPRKNASLKSLSVTLDRCDWLLKAQPRLPVSAKQAFVDIRKGSRTTSQHQRCQTKMADIMKQCHVQKTDLSVSGIRPGTSAGMLVESLFGGTMVHQTRCLECEMARHRQEVFMDISVPVRSLHDDNSDDDSDDDSSDNRNKSGNSCLSKLMQACTNVERLNDANKYFCEQCMHHVEAERSCHYLTLPSVLTLHLKRFSTNSKHFGHVSKLTDKVAIPQMLPCLQYQCKPQCSNSSHMFSLFAIVTHSGTSILHGHYRAYVKVQSHVNPSVFRKLLSSKIKTEEDQLVGTKIDMSSNSDSFIDESNWAAEIRDISKSSLCNNTKSYDDDDDVYVCDKTLNVTANTRSMVSKNKHLGKDVDDIRGTQLKCHSDVDRKAGLCACDHVKPESVYDSSEYGSFWLECDDECIKVMEEHEFIDKLEEKDGCLIGTPYVLFYHKLLM